MGAQNGIVDEDFGTTLPQTEVDNTELAIERNLAKFSQSREYQALKEHLEERIAFYQKYLPDGRESISLPANELGQMWVIANAVIGEFKAVLAAYEQARKVVEEADVQRNGA